MVNLRLTIRVTRSFCVRLTLRKDQKDVAS